MRPFDELIADKTNERAEKAINALTMVMLFATEHKVRLSSAAMDRIDEIGIVLLGQIKRETGFAPGEMMDELQAFTKHIDEHREKLLVPRT